MKTEGDDFNKRFKIANDGDESEEEDKDESAPQIVTADGQASLVQPGTSAKDFLAGMSRSIEKDLHREMLMEQRNMLMRIRMQDTSMRKFQIDTGGFEMDLIEKKVKSKQSDRWEKNAKDKEVIDYSRGQKTQENYQRRLRQFKDVKIAENEHWLVVYPQNIKPLCSVDSEPLTHVQLIPKEFYGSTLELDDDVARDLISLKKTLSRFFKTTSAKGDSKINEAMQTVFIETCFENDIQKGNHMLIDAVAAPNGKSENDSDQEADFDLEMMFEKALLEGDSEWNQSTSKKMIDTKPKRGDL